VLKKVTVNVPTVVVAAVTGSVTETVTVPTPEDPSPDTCTKAVEPANAAAVLERAVPGVPAPSAAVVSTTTRPAPVMEAVTDAPIIVAPDEFLTSTVATARCVPIVREPVIARSSSALVPPAAAEVRPDLTTILVVPPVAVAAAATVIETD
jgi:hypothetical protein